MTTHPVAMLTGHRKMTAQQVAFVRAELPRIAAKLRDEHSTTVGVSGMALGADTLWADAVLEAGLELWAYLPFPQQADRWPEHARTKWRALRGAASLEHVTDDKFSVRALHGRNYDMVQAADLAVAVWAPSQDTGGTASCVKMIRRAGLPLIVVDLDQMRTHWDHG